jgi:hypothetical protein
MKALVIYRDLENLSGVLHLSFDVALSDDNGRAVRMPDFCGGVLPRQRIPFTGAAASMLNNIETKVIAMAAGVGVTLGVTDLVIPGLVQGA